MKPYNVKAGKSVAKPVRKASKPKGAVKPMKRKTY